MSGIDLSRFSTYSMAAGRPTVSVTRNGVTFSKAAILKLEKPEYVKILFDYENKLLLIMKAEKEEEGSTNFLSKGKKVISVRWNNQGLLSDLEDLMNWNLSTHSFSVEATYMKEQDALLFKLSEAEATEVK